MPYKFNDQIMAFIQCIDMQKKTGDYADRPFWIISQNLELRLY